MSNVDNEKQQLLYPEQPNQTDEYTPYDQPNFIQGPFEPQIQPQFAPYQNPIQNPVQYPYVDSFAPNVPPIEQPHQQQQQQYQQTEQQPLTRKERRRLRKSYRRRRGLIWKVVIAIVILIIVISVVVAVKKKKSNTKYPYYGSGEQGEVCPYRAYYYSTSQYNSFSYCSNYDYTCTRNNLVKENSTNYNLIFTTTPDSCYQDLEALTCVPMSPYVNYFAPQITLGQTDQQITICDFYCDTVYSDCKDAYFDCSSSNPFPHQHCNEAVGSIYHDSQSFCQQVLYLSVSSDKQHCFASFALSISPNFTNLILTVLFSILFSFFF
ncbi:folate receptor family protein [Anaeramoeba ignava]|uniref:Folate receptor family protein n=1 Tax=Anaeramoeba ignava TaxID=1746090 RepID=A0A9Q0R7I8_ANAIG|nr:folate receptor family protein [Anaeramoeba ignava]|eukprot:Anaeramoba_ignava/a611663_70.p1 GENE.a611663_70~~a611663_70.p1  ORF type:complete len:322 (-),score=99.63 a611663_70:116-1081(-)